MNRTRFWRFAGLATVLSCASLLPSARVQAAQSILLRAHFVVGQHFTEAATTNSIQKIDFTIGTGSKAQKQSSSDLEQDYFVATSTVVKVYSDGSADLKLTFGPSKVIKNGKTVTYSMAGFYRMVRVSSSFHRISTKDFGTKSLPAVIAAALPSTDPIPYPAKALAVGGSWIRSQPQAPFGTLKEKIVLVALGTQGGRTSATLHAVISQPALFTSQGLKFEGHLNGGNDSQILVDTQQDLISSRASLDFSGKISGVTGGFPVKGTFSFTYTGGAAPQP